MPQQIKQVRQKRVRRRGTGARRRLTALLGSSPARNTNGGDGERLVAINERKQRPISWNAKERRQGAPSERNSTPFYQPTFRRPRGSHAAMVRHSLKKNKQLCPSKNQAQRPPATTHTLVDFEALAGHFAPPLDALERVWRAISMNRLGGSSKSQKSSLFLDPDWMGRHLIVFLIFKSLLNICSRFLLRFVPKRLEINQSICTARSHVTGWSVCSS